MQPTTLQVALIDGPTYVPLYRIFEEFEHFYGIKVKVTFRGTHPELNRHMQEVFISGQTHYDLISTHTKYAPAQGPFLQRLDDCFVPEELEDFSPALLELARIQGALKSIPRNFDARLLLYRADRFEELGITVPQTWEELGEASKRAKAAGYTGFVYPGKESGLVGTFFELLASEGGELFDEQLQPAFTSDAGFKALHLLREWYRQGLTPATLPDMHYDEVSACFQSGDSTMVTDWPGYFRLLNEPLSPVYNRFDLALTPAGTNGKRAVYGGSHSFAVPAASQNLEHAIKLLKFITSVDAQRIDADHGHVPVRTSVMMHQMDAAEPGTIEAKRWAMLKETIATCIVIPPKFPEYPETEDILWKALRRCILGEISEVEALSQAAVDIDRIVGKYAKGEAGNRKGR